MATTMAEAARWPLPGRRTVPRWWLRTDSGQGRFRPLLGIRGRSRLSARSVLRLPERGAHAPLGLPRRTPSASTAICAWPHDVLNGPGRSRNLVPPRADAFIGASHQRQTTPLSPELAGIATSLRLATGRNMTAKALLARLLDAIDRRVGRARYSANSPPAHPGFAASVSL